MDAYSAVTRSPFHLDRLDPRIRAKRAALEVAKDARFAAADALRTREETLRADLVAKKRWLDYDTANSRPEKTLVEQGRDLWTGAPGVGVVTVGGGPGPHRQREIDRLTEDLAQVAALYRAAAERAAAAGRIWQAVDRWLDQRADPSALVPVLVPYKHVGDPRGELIALGQKLVTIDQEVTAIEAAPVPKAEALARLDEHRAQIAARLDERRARSVPSFFMPRGVGHVGALGLAEGFGRVAREVEEAIVHAAEAHFLATYPEWREAIEAYPVNGDAIPMAERPARLSQLARRRRDLVQRLEVVVLSAERDGVDLDRPAVLAEVPEIVLTTTLGDVA
jgi:hypothetical protein